MPRSQRSSYPSYYHTLSTGPLNHYVSRDDYQALCRGTACEQLAMAEDPQMPYGVRKHNYELAIANLRRAKNLPGKFKPEAFTPVIDIANQHLESLLAANQAKLLGASGDEIDAS